MASVQTRLDKAILAHEQAEAEVERLCDIVERAADALNKARQTKRSAQKELDEAAKAAKASGSSPRHAVVTGQHAGVVLKSGPLRNNSSPGALASQPRYSEEADQGGTPRSKTPAGRQEGAELAEQYSDEPRSDYSEEDSEEDYSEEEESDEDDEDEDEDEGDGFDMGNEALEQIRYRLETAKIDPNSPDGTKILDELLIRLQNSKEEVIDAQMVNELIDELLFEPDGAAEQDERKPPPPQNPQQHPRIRINRGGKVLGWYQGQLDERGYAREGRGSMYYDAGHECHGTWENDEMVGRGIYQWSDGHVYDGEWLNGKRHGLGRFVRPDNVVLFGRYEKGHHKGEGVRWSADRREAQAVVDGVPNKTVSLAVARKMAKDLGFDDVLPPPV
eukprot:CAMPEP_0172531472 /NCGR_PEP_ID=MMETSP1067-20121228/4871_1 /TAXON_ID=265564 ORGANISM="Thalassiosira punctigera, Strain Tpunct2005C2" /NCGR_SAMPLE_ID=MMETSP1067 /ASSEMBLY_ACC=CAM_ASM_000444 /LENGTH=388 /DNA_ID=CAMNT_0013315857 /DNA_START=31 /DNA_END=1197 /DNA_ORIENTATION=+